MRAAIATYVSGLHRSLDADRVAVTSSGVGALMIAMQMLVGHGDEVVAVVPVWPNLTAQPAILGAQRRGACALRPRMRALWQLDLDRPDARQLTPAHARAAGQRSRTTPTGWMLGVAAEQLAMLGALPALRTHPRSWPTRSTSGCTSVADSPPPALARTRPPAPCRTFGETGPVAVRRVFCTLPADDYWWRAVYSFSKSFLITGWRWGWPARPRGHLDAIGKSIQFKIPGALVLVQRGGLAALQMAADFVPALVERYVAARSADSQWPAPPGAWKWASSPDGTPSSVRAGGGPGSAGLCRSWSSGMAWAWRRAWPSVRKARAGCAGALRHATGSVGRRGAAPCTAPSGR